MSPVEFKKRPCHPVEFKGHKNVALVRVSTYQLQLPGLSLSKMLDLPQILIDDFSLMVLDDDPSSDSLTGLVLQYLYSHY